MPAYLPTYNQPKAGDSKVTYEVARDYFKDNVYKGSAKPFSNEWNDAMNEWTMGVEEAFGKRYHEGYKDLTYAQLTGAEKPKPVETTPAPGGGTATPGATLPDLPPALNLPPVSKEPLTPNLPFLPNTGQTTPPPASATPPANEGSLGGQTVPLATGSNTNPDFGPVQGNGGPPKADAPVAAYGKTLANGMTPFELVKAPEPIKAPPPVTDKLGEIIMAGRDAKKKAQAKKGYMSSILAGETGGFVGKQKALIGATPPLF